MTFNEEKLNDINNRFLELKKKSIIPKYNAGLGIDLDTINESKVIRCGLVISTVEDLHQLIEELTLLEQAIEEETGLVLRK